MISFAGLISILSSFYSRHDSGFSIEVEVDNLRCDEGVVQFVLYNKDGSFPEEYPTHFFRKLTGEIIHRSSKVVFSNIPEGVYAINAFHDENSDHRINKFFMKPKEGVGFSNHNKISIVNRPTFRSSSFHLNKDLKIEIKMIYL
jgi:uncharacterized protein (DUF2141 family)